MSNKFKCKMNISQHINQIHVNSHKRKSNNQRPNLYCNRGDCRKAFSHQMLLDIHLNLHDNNLIKCHCCPWKGAKYPDFVEHMNRHFQIRPFKCSFCDTSYYVSGTRNQHEKDIHEKILDRYKCEMCPFISHSFGVYNQHKRKHH